MNERIQTLAKQAGVVWKEQLPRFTNTNNPIDFPVSANRDLEKFAELIVEECVQACINKGKTYEVKLAGEYQSAIFADAIKQHFGINDD